MQEHLQVKKDYRQDITNEIIKAIEAGTSPLQKKWDKEKAGFLTRPRNGFSDRAYNGANALRLFFKAAKLSDSNQCDPRWYTFKQANEKQYKVKKGSKATTVEFWLLEEKTKTTDANGVIIEQTVKLKKPKVFYSKVFHASQLENVPEYKIEAQQWNDIKKAEDIISKSGAKIQHDSDKAFYTPSLDEIHLPPKKTFESVEDYYAVALHELGHWTGHESRLDRDQKGVFGSENYAREELRAEMASLYISMDLGIPYNTQSVASYQESWLKVLKKDKNEFFKAAKDADKIAKYVLDIPEKIQQVESNYNLERLDKIKNVDLPMDTSTITASQEYCLQVQNQLNTICEQVESIDDFKNFDRKLDLYKEYLFSVENSLKTDKIVDDKKITRHMLLKGYPKYKIVDVISKCTPHNLSDSAAYAKKIMQSVSTPEFEKELKTLKTKQRQKAM